jgi:hypothetical protein
MRRLPFTPRKIPGTLFCRMHLFRHTLLSNVMKLLKRDLKGNIKPKRIQINYNKNYVYKEFYNSQNYWCFGTLSIVWYSKN